MASYNYPYHITKDTPAVANEVQSNFDGLLTWLMGNVIQKDGSVSMTGPLVLAPGEPASPDQAANKAYVDSIMPVGVMFDYVGTSLPTGWLWCNGNTYTNQSHPALAAAIGRAFTEAAVPAGSFQVPDMRKRVSVGFDATDAAFALGKTGGQRDSEVMTHLHAIPDHGHTATGTATDHPVHLHPAGTLATPDSAGHGHNIGDGAVLAFAQAGGPGAFALGSGWGVTGAWETAGAKGGVHKHTSFTGNTGNNAAVQTHTLTVAVADKPTFDTVAAGAGTTTVDKNLPPYVTVNVIIYAGA